MFKNSAILLNYNFPEKNKRTNKKTQHILLGYAADAKQ